MPNIHTPERLPEESQAQYRDRRKVSKIAAKRATQSTTPHPTDRHGQYRNPLRNRLRKLQRMLKVQKKRRLAPVPQPIEKDES